MSHSIIASLLIGVLILIKKRRIVFRNLVRFYAISTGIILLLLILSSSLAEQVTGAYEDFPGHIDRLLWDDPPFSIHGIMDHVP